jgi:hypothetical protein
MIGAGSNWRALFPGGIREETLAAS